MEMDWDHDELRWTRKSKRSRRTPEAAANADEYSAAESLILLANCGGGFCPAVSTSKKHQETPSSSATEESDQAVAGATTAADVKKKEAVKKEEAVSPDSPLLMAPTFHNSTDHCCSVCGKVFQSHQALGGHKTSHRAATASHRNSVAHAAAAAGDKIHKCCFCNAVFPTGQALGGHKRKHYRGPPLLRKVDCIAGDSPDGGATRHDGRPLFDLNMPPPPECDYDQEDHCRNWIMNYDS